MDVTSLRYFIETAYRHAWGLFGSATARDEFHSSYNQVKHLTGEFSYKGNGEFVWTTTDEDDDLKEYLAIFIKAGSIVTHRVKANTYSEALAQLYPGNDISKIELIEITEN